MIVTNRMSFIAILGCSFTPVDLINNHNPTYFWWTDVVSVENILNLLAECIKTACPLCTVDRHHDVLFLHPPTFSYQRVWPLLVLSLSLYFVNHVMTWSCYTRMWDVEAPWRTKLTTDMYCNDSMQRKPKYITVHHYWKICTVHHYWKICTYYIGKPHA